MESTLQRPHLAAQVLRSEAVPENHRLINIPRLLGPERLLLNSFPLLPPHGPQATYSPRTHARILEPPPEAQSTVLTGKLGIPPVSRSDHNQVQSTCC